MPFKAGRSSGTCLQYGCGSARPIQPLLSGTRRRATRCSSHRSSTAALRSGRDKHRQRSC